eukprot:CAMPEP_0178451046 /NCGR_PEP_ID=MMETSP0689_2-20121128/43463_1 /TAXON_ID=160604 /ORGANISM="Amphidinium massartii, Strain CS-259" /LENGTH=228 /DNA_ID=CAMNT_0020076581 /DNA_START=277 /DNA_END=964 /DNA_ORIENTATION=-
MALWTLPIPVESEATAWSNQLFQDKNKRLIQATCLGQQPVPVTLQLRANWQRLFHRVLLGVAGKPAKRGCPSATTAERTLAMRRFLRFRSCTDVGTELAASGAGGLRSSGTWMPTVFVSTALLFLLPPPAAVAGKEAAPSQDAVQLLKDKEPKLRVKRGSGGTESLKPLLWLCAERPKPPLCVTESHEPAAATCRRGGTASTSSQTATSRRKTWLTLSSASSSTAPSS